MPTIEVIVGVSVRPDGGGNTHDGFDKMALAGTQQLFAKPVKIGRNAVDTDVSITVVSIPKVPEKYKDWRAGLANLNDKDAVPALHSARIAFDVAELDGIDLLYVPGAPVASPSQTSNVHKMVANSDFKKAEALSRDAFEARVIEAAMTRGIPILAVCAGSWRLVEAYGGYVRELSKADAGIHRHDGWNCNHPLVVEPEDMQPTGVIASAARAAGPNPVAIKGSPGLTLPGFTGANSTHWAVAASRSGGGALEKRDTPLGRASDLRVPDAILKPVAFEPGTESVEAFETSFGVPVVGTQWHPESFLPGMDECNGSYSNDGIKTFSREIFRVLLLTAVTAKLRRSHVAPSLREALSSGAGLPTCLAIKLAQLKRDETVREGVGRGGA